MSHRGLKIILLITIFWSTFISNVVADPPVRPAFQPTFETTACPFELPLVSFVPPESQGFQCGYVTVPEQHAEPDGPTIRLPVAILPALSENPQPDPVFVAQGGPGGDAFSIFSLIIPNSSLREDRDVVIFNQRGTLHTEPNLICTEVQEALPDLLTLPVEEGNQLSQEKYTECFQRLQMQGINLSAYNSLENAADVEAIRQALGYETFNFYGVSYGTLLGLHVMRHHPDNLRSVILDGVVPTQLNFIPMIPKNTDRIFTELISVCDDDAGCRSDYPDLETRFFALVDRFNNQPITLPLTDPETDLTIDTRIDGDTLMALLFQTFYLPNAYAVFPKVIADIEQGDFSFIQDISPLILFDRTISDGMYFSVICAEDADFSTADIPLDGVRPQIAKNALRDLEETYLDVCQFWSVDPLPPVVDEPVTSDIPTLLLSGRFDPITPPGNADVAGASLTRSYSYVDPVGSHGVFVSSPCVNRIVETFLDNPDTSPDADCLNDMMLEEFAPPNLLRVDLIGKINQLNSATAIQVGLAGFLLLGVLSALLIWPLVFLIRLISKKEPKIGSMTLRRGSRTAIIIFGLVAILFVVGLNFFLFQTVTNDALLLLSSVPASAAPIFILPFILAGLALLILVLMISLWLKREGSIWGRLYYTLLTLCAVGYVVLLVTTGMFTVFI